MPASDERQTFNLVDEPWLRVRMLDGGLKTLSLRECFLQLGEIRELGGEASQQDFAVLRLLVALGHASQRGVTGTPEQVWKDMWSDRGLVGADVVDYLDEWRDRFDLLDADRPFLQVAGLTTGKDQIFPLERLVLDVPNDVDKPYFTMRAGEGLRRLDLAEAARWVVMIQAADVSGIKTGVLGDDRVKGGKGYPIGTAVAASLGGIVLQGETLEETLLLNLVLGDPDSNADRRTPTDVPVWEAEVAPGPGVWRIDGRQVAPTGPASLLTWPSRRILLQLDNGAVVGCLIANGDPLDVSEYRDLEDMCAWRQPASDIKTRTTPVLRPVRHDPERAFWRGIASILPSPDGTRVIGATKRAVILPGNVRWVDRMRANGVIAPDRLVTARAYGLALDSNNAMVQDSIDDSVDLVVGLFDSATADLASVIEKAARDAESAVYALGRLRQRIADAAGNRDTDARGVATAAGFFAVGEPFRLWLRDIRPSDDPEQALADWHNRVRTVVVELGRTYIDEAPPGAIMGREANGRLVNAPLAERWFLNDLDTNLPLSTEALARARRRAEREQRTTTTTRTEAAS